MPCSSNDTLHNAYRLLTAAEIGDRRREVSQVWALNTHWLITVEHIGLCGKRERERAEFSSQLIKAVALSLPWALVVFDIILICSDNVRHSTTCLHAWSHLKIYASQRWRSQIEIEVWKFAFINETSINRYTESIQLFLQCLWLELKLSCLWISFSEMSCRPVIGLNLSFWKLSLMKNLYFNKVCGLNTKKRD